MKLIQDQKGQSAAEFVLIAPFLFLFLFCVIQLAYMSYVSLAVQRAALAAARRASLSASENTASFKTQLALSLLPLANLSPKTLLTLMAADCVILPPRDKNLVTVKVRYPMPIWVPLARNLFGDPLLHPSPRGDSPEGKTVKMIFSILHKPEPNLTFTGPALPVKWISFEETTFNEGTRTP